MFTDPTGQTRLPEMSLLGIDIGGTSIKWVRLAPGGNRIDEGSLPTPQTGPSAVVDALADLYRFLPGEPVASIGIAVPGHVDTSTGATTLVPNLPGEWSGYPFGATVRERLAVPAALINDARAFGVAELRLGAARGADRAAFVVLGTGMGGAVALGGRVLRNLTDSVGEFGHSTVVRDGERCGCGNLGCAEAYVGGRAMARRYQLSGATGLAALPDSVAVLDRLRADYDAGVRSARQVVDLAVWATGCAVTNLCVALRISTVVIGGGLGNHWPEFAAGVARQLADREILLGPSIVSGSALGDRAGAVGAALSAASKPSECHFVSEKEMC